MNKKDYKLNYFQLYFFVKKIKNGFQLDLPISEIRDYLLKAIEIPRTDGVLATLIIGVAGCPYFSKINEHRAGIINSEVEIGGFISALFSFSRNVIGQESGGKLKELNFGEQRFYMINKKKVIFAYLVDRIDPLIQRYIYITADEFLDKYKEHINNFNGNVTPFKDFENDLNQYFII